MLQQSQTTKMRQKAKEKNSILLRQEKRREGGGSPLENTDGTVFSMIFSPASLNVIGTQQGIVERWTFPLSLWRGGGKTQQGKTPPSAFSGERRDSLLYHHKGPLPLSFHSSLLSWTSRTQQHIRVERQLRRLGDFF